MQGKYRITYTQSIYTFFYEKLVAVLYLGTLDHYLHNSFSRELSYNFHDWCVSRQFSFFFHFLDLMIYVELSSFIQRFLRNLWVIYLHWEDYSCNLFLLLPSYFFHLNLHSFFTIYSYFFFSEFSWEWFLFLRVFLFLSAHITGWLLW